MELPSHKRRSRRITLCGLPGPALPSACERNQRGIDEAYCYPAVFVAVVLTAAYTVITLYDENMKVGRMWETPAVHPHEQPLLIMEPGVVPFDGGEAEYRNAKAEDLISPFKNDDSKVVASGKSHILPTALSATENIMTVTGRWDRVFIPFPVIFKATKFNPFPRATSLKRSATAFPTAGNRHWPLPLR